MRLQLMNGDELRIAYETDLTEAFPPSELKPLFAMEDLRSKGLYDPRCFLEDDGTILGYALLCGTGTGAISSSTICVSLHP